MAPRPVHPTPAGRRSRRPKPPSSTRRRLLVGAPIVAVVAVVVALIGLSLSGASSVRDVTVTGGPQIAGMLEGLPQEGAFLGDADAPVTVTEYVDLRCPACARYAIDQLPLLIDSQVRPGRIRLERRVWPILGPDSESAAIAASAALAQNRLWDYTEVWFANQQPEDNDYVDDEFVLDVAREAGLDVSRFQGDLETGVASSAGLIAATDEAARALDLRATPSLVVTDAEGRSETLQGYPQPGELERAIAAALAG